MVRLSLNVSDELASVLDRIATESETTKSEILRKALTLYEVARAGSKEGKTVGLVKNGAVVTEVVGF